jgi:hypothetical protein
VSALGVKHDHSFHLGHQFSSEVHLETTSGLLVGRTRSVSTTLWSRVRSASRAIVLDADGDVVATGPLTIYEASDASPGQHEQRHVWAVQLSPRAAGPASMLAVIHSWNTGWLERLGDELPPLETLTRLLARSANGGIGTGGAMRWPDDELPWASFAGGYRRPADGPPDPTTPQRCVRTLTHAGMLAGEPTHDGQWTCLAV